MRQSNDPARLPGRCRFFVSFARLFVGAGSRSIFELSPLLLIDVMTSMAAISPEKSSASLSPHVSLDPRRIDALDAHFQDRLARITTSHGSRGSASIPSKPR